MTEDERSAWFAIKRIQAARNCEKHIQQLLFKAARNIVDTAEMFTNKKNVMYEEQLLKVAENIAEKTEFSIEAYTKAYAKTAAKLLNVDNSDVGELFEKPFFGDTFQNRNRKYIRLFAHDIVKMVKAATALGYSKQKIIAAVRTGYKNPYKISVITKARRNSIPVDTPQYGKGVMSNAYQDIVRNARQTILAAWGRAEQQYGKNNQAIAFTVHRGSSYPCPICDEQCAYTHKMKDPFPPFHVSCVCYTKFIFKDKE